MTEFEEEDARALAYINATPLLQSLLYDLDLMPEQLAKHSPQWAHMLTVVAYMRVALNPND